MVDALQNLQVVYAKWEERNPHLQGGKLINTRNDVTSLNDRRPWVPTTGHQPRLSAHRSTRNKGRSRRYDGFENNATSVSSLVPLKM
jgi:hypothetical protein